MKRKKYALGTPLDYMSSPSEELAEDHINKTKAEYEAQSNPLLMGMEFLGTTLLTQGLKGAGIDPTMAVGVDQMTKQFSNGGKAQGKVEVEGEEVYETASGKTGEFKGAKHEQGGIDVNLDEPTNIFSDRILVQGKTMAERKKNRLNKIKKLEKQLANNPTDKATKNTYERTLASLNNEEEKDLKTQEVISSLVGTQGEAMFGLNGDIGFFDLFKKDKSHQGTNPLIDYDAIDKDFSNLSTDNIDASTNGATKMDQSSTSEGGFMDTLSKMFAPSDEANTNTTGNALSIAGNLFSGITPLLTTLKNRATDTPNTNEFKNFGKDAIDANIQAQSYVEGVKSNALKDTDRTNIAAKRRARKSSRSVNTQRATDLVSDQSTNQANESIQDNFANQMMQLLTQKSGLENQQDQVVMQGEQARDLADRKDKDNFYSNKSQNLATLGQAVQQTGKDLNQAEQQEVMMKILNQLSKYGITFNKDMKMQNPE